MRLQERRTTSYIWGYGEMSPMVENKELTGEALSIATRHGVVCDIKVKTAVTYDRSVKENIEVIAWVQTSPSIMMIVNFFSELDEFAERHNINIQGDISISSSLVMKYRFLDRESLRELSKYNCDNSETKQKISTQSIRMLEKFERITKRE